MLCKPNVNVYTDDLFDLSYKIQDDEAQTRFSEVVQSGRLSAEKTSGCSCRGSSVKLVWPLIQGKYESSTLRNIYYQAALRLGPYSDTFVDYYLLLSDRLYSNLSAKPGGNLVNYRGKSVFHSTFFKLHSLDQFNLKNCFNIGLHRIQSTAKSNNSLYENVHWVRWEPNVERINEVGPNFMIEYKFFVHQIMSKRTALVMPSVENWFRGCRRDLYEIGLTDKTTVGQVNVEQFFKLFKYLRSRPDYESSPLRQVIAMTETTSFSSSTDGYKGQVVSPSSLTYI